MQRFMDSYFSVGMCLLVLTSSAHAEEGVAGTIKVENGDVHIVRNGVAISVKVGDFIKERDHIVTGTHSSAGVTLKDDTLISIGQNSNLVINQFSFNSTTHAGGIDTSLITGAMKFVFGLIAKESPISVALHTPVATIGVRGTEFIVDVTGDQ